MSANSDSGAEARAGAGGCQDEPIEGSFTVLAGDTGADGARDVIPGTAATVPADCEVSEGSVTSKNNQALSAIAIAKKAAPGAMQYVAELASGMIEAPHTARIEAAKIIMRASGVDRMAERLAQREAGEVRSVHDMTAEELMHAARVARSRLATVAELLPVPGPSDSQSVAQAPQVIDPPSASTRASADCAQTVPLSPDQPLPDEASEPAERPESDAWSLD